MWNRFWPYEIGTKMENTTTEGSGDSVAVEQPNNEITYESTSHPVQDAGESQDSTTTDEGLESQEEKPESEGSEGTKKKAPGSVRKKIKIEHLTNEVSQLKAQLAQLQGQSAPKEQAGSDPDKEPSETDYENVLDYLKAHQKWTAKQELQSYTKEQKELSQQQAAEAAYQVKEQAYVERLMPLAQADPELVDRLEQYEQQGLITKHLESAVFDSPMGEKITEYLDKNPQDFLKFQGLTEAQTYKAIGLLEAKLSNPQGQEAAAVRKTSAAAPIKPIGKQASTANKKPEEMTQEEIEAWRYSNRG